MAFAGAESRQYALGRECKLFVDDKEAKGISDVVVRETVVSLDATEFNGSFSRSVVTQRSYDISVSIPDIAFAKELYAKRIMAGDQQTFVPGIVNVRLIGGLFEIEGEFTIHDVDADEPLDGVVVPRFSLKQWGTAKKAVFSN